MEEQIKKALIEKVNPILGEHSGGAVMTKFEDGVVTVRLTGACSGCPSAQMTTEEIVKEILMEEVAEVKDVKLDTSVSDDLIEMARKLMRGER
ncbi:MAG: NifU family protein [Firmicutes bacterium]|nr:NifU family protein [Bacillota bacterium]MBQ4340435.1 NifU family protein [Bacillota bacterium]